jgi:hypothetical protein
MAPTHDRHRGKHLLCVEVSWRRNIVVLWACQTAEPGWAGQAAAGASGADAGGRFRWKGRGDQRPAGARPGAGAGVAAGGSDGDAMPSASTKLSVVT